MPWQRYSSRRRLSENLMQSTGILPGENKTNTFDLIGPANTGKTLFIKPASVFLRVMKTQIYMYIYFVCLFLTNNHFLS